MSIKSGEAHDALFGYPAGLNDCELVMHARGTVPLLTCLMWGPDLDPELFTTNRICTQTLLLHYVEFHIGSTEAFCSEPTFFLSP